MPKQIGNFTFDLIFRTTYYTQDATQELKSASSAILLVRFTFQGRQYKGKYYAVLYQYLCIPTGRERVIYDMLYDAPG